MFRCAPEGATHSFPDAERSASAPIGSDRWGNREIPEYPPIGNDELERLKAGGVPLSG
jgi:hypothetical protein